MKNLVTGGAGYIGSHVCHLLIDQGYNVTCIDSLITGNKELLPKEVKLEVFDISDNEKVTNLIKSNNFDLVMHFAGLIRVDESVEQPERYRDFNFVKAKTFLETCYENNLKKVIFSSTAAVYGNPKIHPQIEEYFGSVNPIGIRSCYDEGKRISESLCFDFSRTYSLEIKVARIFNTYGPSMSLNDGRVISNFIIQALTKKPFTIFGKGDQSRSFCYVEDLIEGLLKFMDSNHKGPINLGNPEEITIKNLAYLISGKVGNEFLFKEMSLPIDDPKMRKPSIEKAIKLINWEPNYSLSRGLDLTIEYFKKVIN